MSPRTIQSLRRSAADPKAGRTGAGQGREEGRVVAAGRSLAGGLLLAALLWAAGAGPVWAGPTNRGGALLLTFQPDAVYELGTFDHCDQLTLAGPEAAVLRVPADGAPRIAGLYAVFPEDSVGTIRAISFGLRYSPSVRIVGSGPCNAGGMEISMNGWPRSYGGASVHIMPEGVKAARIIPIYWFALLAREGGTFEVIPHPMPRLGGRMANADVPPVDAPIVDFGRLGFDTDGYLPQTGLDAPVGACCVDGQCWLLTRRECSVYGGVWFGTGIGCEHEPCRDEALGGCCLDTGCEPMSLIECVQSGGVPLGVGVRCGDRPCPPPAGELQPGAPGAAEPPGTGDPSR